MHLNLEVKKYHNFFWLRAIYGARRDKCCIECFNAKKDNRVYHATRCKKYALVSIDIDEDPKALAYYLCGISAGSVWENNVHVAFIPAPGELVEINNDKIGLRITDAREIHFQYYEPAPVGEYTPEQRTCRNWIFSNYILDGKLQEYKENGYADSNQESGTEYSSGATGLPRAHGPDVSAGRCFRRIHYPPRKG